MSVTVAIKIGGVALAGDLVLADVTIRSGRSRTDDGLNPATATVELLTANPGGVVVEIASSLQILINGTSRFIGKISELTSTSSIDGASVTYTIVAAGNIAQLERVVMAVPIAAETAAARANRAITAAGFAATVTGGTTYQMAAYGKAGDAPTTAAQVLSDLMSDTGAVVADAGSGAILAQFPEARISGDTWAPDPAKTHVDVDFEQNDDLVNDATIIYNPAAAASYNAQNSSSITKYGKHSVTLTTGLADIGSATRRGGSIVSRLGIPAWVIGAVETWDETFLAHGVGAVVALSPLPVSSPVGGSFSGILEGWISHFRPLADGSNLMGGTFDLSLSDQRHASEALTWAGANPAEKWNTVNPATRWQDAVSNANL